MEDDLLWREERERRLAEKKDAHASETDDVLVNESEEFREKDDEDIYFAPEKGNVIFASAIDGWGFRVGKFAQLYAQKLGMKEGNLRRVLWGDFFLDPKTKKVISYKHLRGRALKPLFVQFVLENIWAVYDAVVMHPLSPAIFISIILDEFPRNTEKVGKIIATLGLQISPRDLKSKDSRYLLSLIFTQWLSLSTCIIQAVIDIVPAPPIAQATRIPKMLYPELREETKCPRSKLEEDLYGSRSGTDAFVVAYVTKMFVVPAKDLPEKKRNFLSADEMRARGRETRTARQAEVEPGKTSTSTDAVDDGSRETPEEVVLGFARLYSGTIRIGSSIYVVLPKYNTGLGPTHPTNTKYLLTANVDALYIMMGRELVLVPEVRAGNVFAIRGLESKVFRSGTLCSPGLSGIGQNPNIETQKDCLVNLGAVNRAVRTLSLILQSQFTLWGFDRLLRLLKLH